MLRENDGSVILAVNDKLTPLTKTSDSWNTEQLCKACESKLNGDYDSYGISIFKGHIGEIGKTPSGICFKNVDSGRVRMFILSVLWRMSTSTHESYLNTHLPTAIKEELRACLNSGKSFTGSKLHVTLRRLHDSTPTGAIESNQFRDVVMSPFIRRHSTFYAICFLLFGFLVQVYVPMLPPSLRRNYYCLPGNARIIFAPLVEFTDIPELFDLAVVSVFKSKLGLSTIAGA